MTDDSPPPKRPDGLIDLPLRGDRPDGGTTPSPQPRIPQPKSPRSKPLQPQPPQPQPPRRQPPAGERPGAAASPPPRPRDPAPGSRGAGPPPSSTPPGRSEEGPDGPPSIGFDKPRSGVRRQQGARRRRWPWIVLLLLSIGAAYWLLRPEPGRADFGSEVTLFDDVRFGSEGDPIAVTVANGGELPLDIAAIEIRGDGGSDFLVLEDGCGQTSQPSGAECVVSLRFKPTAVGERSAALELLGPRKPMSQPLRGESVAPRLGWQPSVVDFSSHPVGERAAGADLVLSNSGTAEMKLDKVYVDGRHAGEFRLTRRCEKRALAISESCGLRIAFAPGAAGERFAELVVESDAPSGVDRVELRGEGVWDGPELVAEPNRIAAGLRRVGAKGEGRPVRFVNRAAETVEIASLQVSPAAAGFSLNDEGCRGRQLEPGDRCAVSIAFGPKVRGELTATLDLRLAGGGGASVPLSGRGGVAGLGIDRERIDLGAARVDVDRRRESLKVTSTGEVALRIARVTVEGDAASSFAVGSDSCIEVAMAPEGGCSVEIEFRPVAAGPLAARLRIDSDAEGGTVTVPLAGEGLAGRLEASAERVDFGRVHRGAGASQTLGLRNTGTAAWSVDALDVGGAAAAEFVVVEDTCSRSSVEPANECTLSLRFLPGSVGRRLAFLLVAHDALLGPSEIALVGEGLPPVPEIRVEPEALNFAALEVGEIGPIETVTVQNPGVGPLQIRDISLAPGDAGFRLVSGTCSGVPRLAPRSDCSFGVRFTPQSAGAHAAELVIDHDAPGGQTRIRLSGTARGVEPPPAPVSP